MLLKSLSYCRLVSMKCLNTKLYEDAWGYLTSHSVLTDKTNLWCRGSACWHAVASCAVSVPPWVCTVRRTWKDLERHSFDREENIITVCVTPFTLDLILVKWYKDLQAGAVMLMEWNYRCHLMVWNLLKVGSGLGSSSGGLLIVECQ